MIAHCQEKALLKMNDYNLLVETKEYLQQAEIKWSINTTHIKVLFELYLSILDDVTHRLTILKILQICALKQEMAELISKNSRLSNEFIDKIKLSSEPDIKYHSIQLVNITFFNLV